MAVRLYIDEDAMAHALLQGLRARGADLLTAYEAEMTGRDDATQLDFAISQERTLYTFNVADFCRLHTEYMEHRKHHAGIIVMPSALWSWRANSRSSRNRANKDC